MRDLQTISTWFSIVCLCRGVPVYDTPTAIPELNREFEQLQKYLVERKIIPEAFQNGRLAKSLSTDFYTDAPVINELYQQIADEDININSILEKLNENDFPPVYLPNPNLLPPFKLKPVELASRPIKSSKTEALSGPTKIRVDTTLNYIALSQNSENNSSVAQIEKQTENISSNENKSTKAETSANSSLNDTEDVINANSNGVLVSGSIERQPSKESSPAQKDSNMNMSASYSARNPRQDAGSESEETSDEFSSEEAGPDGGDGMGGGLLGLLGGLSGGEGGSDLGTLLATVGGIVGQLSGDGSPPGGKIAQYIITVLDSITGGGASNNGMFFGDFLSRLIKGISAGGDPSAESGSEQHGSDSASFFLSLITALLGGSSAGSS